MHMKIGLDLWLSIMRAVIVFMLRFLMSVIMLMRDGIMLEDLFGKIERLLTEDHGI